MLLQWLKEKLLNLRQIGRILANLAWFIIIVCFPIYLLYKWDFQYVKQLINFLKISWWPLIILFVVLLFKNEISNLINEISELNLFGNKAVRNKEVKEQQSEAPVSTTLPNFSETLTTLYKDLSEKYKDTEIQLKNRLIDTEIALDFERVYNSIFGSQLVLLKHLEETTSMTLGKLVEYFELVQKQNIPLQDWDVNKYLNYLLGSQLLTIVQGEYSITLKGKAFISYIERNRKYSFNKPL